MRIAAKSLAILLLPLTLAACLESDDTRSTSFVESANADQPFPANYKPAAQPLIPWGSTAMPANAPAGTNVSQFWDTNTVWLPLNNGSVQRTTFNDNLHPWRNQYLPGVRQWFQDASLFKFVKVNDRVSVRVNVDFFNVFNNPNNPNSIGGDGVLAVRNSGSGARVTQLGMRLIW